MWAIDWFFWVTVLSPSPLGLHHKYINLMISKLFTWFPIYLRFILEISEGIYRLILIAYNCWFSRMITKWEALGGCCITRLLCDLTTATRWWFIGLFLFKKFIPHFKSQLKFFFSISVFLCSYLINFSCSHICSAPHNWHLRVIFIENFPLFEKQHKNFLRFSLCT